MSLIGLPLTSTGPVPFTLILVPCRLSCCAFKVSSAPPSMVIAPPAPATMSIAPPGPHSTAIRPFAPGRVALAKIVQLLKDQQKLYDEVEQGVRTLNEWEATIKTGTGGDLLTAIEMAALHRDEAGRRINEVQSLIVAYENVPGGKDVIVRIEDLNLRLARLFVLTLNYASRFGQRADALMQSALDFVSHLTVKAWVVEHPDERHQFLKAALKVFDQGINATARAGDAIGSVPDPHTQAASAGVKWSMVAARAGKAVVDKLAISADVNRQIDEVLKDEGLGNMLAKHDTDNLLIARLLADKTKRELDLILELARPIVAVALEWVPYSQIVSKAIDGVVAIISTAVDQYQKERLRRAGDLTMKDVSKFENFHRQMLDKLKQTLERDILAVTDLANLLADALFATLIDDLMAMLMGVLPVDPAQAIDGAALRSKMNLIIASSQARIGVRIEDPSTAIQPRPKVDNAGQAVTLLSGPIDEQTAGGYRYARRADKTIGRLYLADLRFVPADADDQEAARYRTVPETDGRGRPLSEVNLAWTLPMETVPGRTGHRARSLDLIGEIDEQFLQFRPTGPDPERLDPAVWRTRSIDKTRGGYWNLVDGKRADFVQGTWHRPWAARHEILEFRPQSGSRQFVLSHWKTGDPTVLVGAAVEGVVQAATPDAL
ncbi:hypothetical protein [Kribbella sp. NPDC048915]|uniref:hypothetical protein n=1 Tax=Kribbella sp. NPDC048915 TaxID=3155148 RepID=UPI0033FFCC30